MDLSHWIGVIVAFLFIGGLFVGSILELGWKESFRLWSIILFFVSVLLTAGFLIRWGL